MFSTLFNCYFEVFCDLKVILFFPKEKLNVKFFLSDRNLTAVAERCAGKQRPPVKRYRELDDVTYRATGGNGAVTNWHGTERERTQYTATRQVCFLSPNFRAHFLLRFGFFYFLTKPRISSQELIKQLQYENDALQSKIIAVEQTELQEVCCSILPEK